MILKGFKQNSNKKYIESQLKLRKPPNEAVIIKKLGILINSDELPYHEKFLELAKALHIHQNDIKIILFTEAEIEATQFSDTFFNNEALGWNGDIKNEDVSMFINTKFDALISYYKEDKLPLKLVTAASKAQFKIGIFENDERLNDLIIRTNIGDFDTFKIELIKYLRILNRIN